MEYYILVNGGKQGPFSLEELYTKKISPNTMVWKTGMTDWTMAKNMPELADLLASLPPEPPEFNTGKEQGSNQVTMPKTWLVESILVTLFCCLPFGIVGIVYSTQISSFYNHGNFAAAEEASRNAGKWTKIGFFTGLAVYVIYFLFYLILGASLVGASMIGLGAYDCL